MRPEEAAQVARYHQQGIPTGVLSELGVRFLTRLYTAIVRSADGFVFVALSPGERVIGFVCGTTNLGAVFRRVLLRHGWRLVGDVLRCFLRWRMIRRVAEALLYPAKMDRTLPQAELLSIVVDPEARGCGAADGLLEALLAEFRQRDCPLIKVMVRADFERANAYYVKHGFRLAGTIHTHGYQANIYLIETGL